MFGHAAHAGRRAWRIATFAALSLLAVSAATAAQAETRVLKFYNLHTKEKASFAYKRNGRYDRSELKKINWFLRDWRKSEPTTMDPRLMDVIWEAYRQSGSRSYINVISGYRSPGTNSMLRSRSSGVAKKSQHTLGKALDFQIPDVPLAKMREIGLKMQVGGVGYYPRSGSPFVHFDVGNARHWPRMSRKQLLAVFPNGNTVHVPSDGKPLPGYQQALASYKQRRGASEIQVANASSSSSGGGKTLLAMLFGGGSDEAEDDAEAGAAPARAAPVQRAVSAPVVALASAVPQSRPSLPGGVAMPVGDRFDTGAPTNVASSEEPTVVASLDTARIPVPTWAPVRATAQTPIAGSQAPVVPAARSKSDAVSTLVAALEAQATETAASGQLAYVVPTPRDRPMFDDLLKTDKAPSATTRQAIESVVAAAMPVARPVIEPKTAQPAAMMKVAAAATPPTPARSRPTATKIPLDGNVSSDGKGDRVMRAAARPAVKSMRIDPQEAINSRIEIASLVSDSNRRAEQMARSSPDTGRLVGDLPRTLFAGGFTPSHATGKTDRFSGSAVNFLPLVKLKQ
ncbi:DUF882 domain-containing protein [Aurantimonas marina]|uniref:DUF882 domain-containing protein n=1 Tax=Aurantimonas marina TaxID=2780508 RepID=UPI0019D27F88|nr:DUF882 domain-containing protein [Aurantimonas marina]